MEQQQDGTSIKVAVFGDILGNFDVLTARLDKLASLGFVVAFCTGQFFADSLSIDASLALFRSKEKKFALPVYFIKNRENDPALLSSGCEIAPNLYFLGDHGVKLLTLNTKAKNTIRVGYLGSQSVLSTPNQRMQILSTIESQSNALNSLPTPSKQPSAPQMDIFLTNVAPMGMFSQTSAENLPKSKVNRAGNEDAVKMTELEAGSIELTQFLSTNAPQYTFIGRQGYHFMLPTCSTEATSSTGQKCLVASRFYSLAPLANVLKLKDLVAFSLILSNTVPFLPVISSADTLPGSPFPQFASNHTPSSSTQANQSDISLRKHTFHDRFESVESEQRDRESTFSAAGRFQAKPRPGYQCKICGSPDHFIQMCPQKMERMEKRNQREAREMNSENPYDSTDPNAHPDKRNKSSTPPEDYVCRLCSTPGHWIQDCPQATSHTADSHPKHQHTKTSTATPCWFCLSSNEEFSHLVVSVADETYAAIPRGQMLSGHVHLIPNDHVDSSVSAPHEVTGEFQQYISALQKMYNATEKTDVLVFERNIVLPSSKRVNHMQLNIFPIPSSKSENFLPSLTTHLNNVLQSFVDQSILPTTDISKYTILELTPDQTLASLESKSYIHFQLLSQDTDNKTYLKNFVLVLDNLLQNAMEFSSQASGEAPKQPNNPIREVLLPMLNLFPFTVVANVLGIPERADWKNQIVSKEDEAKDAEAFKLQFEPYDFAAEL